MAYSSQLLSFFYIAEAGIRICVCIESRSIIRRAQTRRRSLRDASRATSKQGRITQSGFEAWVQFSDLTVRDLPSRPKRLRWISPLKPLWMRMRRQEIGTLSTRREVRCRRRREKVARILGGECPESQRGTAGGLHLSGPRYPLRLLRPSGFRSMSQRLSPRAFKNPSLPPPGISLSYITF